MVAALILLLQLALVLLPAFVFSLAFVLLPVRVLALALILETEPLIGLLATHHISPPTAMSPPMLKDGCWPHWYLPIVMIHYRYQSYLRRVGSDIVEMVTLEQC